MDDLLDEDNVPIFITLRIVKVVLDLRQVNCTARFTLIISKVCFGICVIRYQWRAAGDVMQNCFLYSSSRPPCESKSCRFGQLMNT